MFNLKVSGIAAGAGFFLSLLIGFLGRSSMPVLLIRPAIFAVLFFAVTCLIYILVNNFLPELLDKDGPEKDFSFLPGSRINITESGSPPSSAQAFLGAQADDSDEGLGNISDLVKVKSAASRDSGGGTREGMDQNPQDGYNEEGNLEYFSEPESSFTEGASGLSGGSAGAGTYQAGVEAAGGEEGFPDSVDILPDLDSMASAFLPSAGNEESDTTEYSVSTPAPKPSSGSKAPAWGGDFNAKDLAAGLRTIISKEKEG